MSTARLLVAAALGAALATVWSPAASAQQGRSKKYVATRAITVDRQTGQLRVPTAEETQELVDRLVAMTNRSTDGLQAVTLANGTTTVDLQGRFESVMVARPNPDGTSEVRCVNTFAEAADFLGLVEAPSQQ
ncbi:MAG TPA: hypothetical protein VH417_11595 [Vicinamibacterales bacterium]|jgi:hypothetical protein